MRRARMRRPQRIRMWDRGLMRSSRLMMGFGWSGWSRCFRSGGSMRRSPQQSQAQVRRGRSAGGTCRAAVPPHPGNQGSRGTERAGCSVQRSRCLRVRCGCASVSGALFAARIWGHSCYLLPLCAVVWCGAVACYGLRCYVLRCYGARSVLMCGARCLGRRRRVSGSLQDYAHPRDSFASLAFVCQS